MNSDEVFRAWMADLKSIADDVYELFALRRTFRDVAEVFRRNPRLQAEGGHLWTWMLLNYVASVLMRVRSLVDSQPQTVNLKQLMHAIIERPDVLSRGRRRALHGPVPPYIQQAVDHQFTSRWVRSPRPESDRDCVDPEIVRGDLRALQAAVARVTEFANRTIAHKTRVSPGEITFAEIDAAFDAIERALQDYYTLLLGGSLLQAEPTPQFNTHEVFSFPWISTEERPQ